jgi:uncharacterized membrane protein HdeD (DUF308 family)
MPLPLMLGLVSAVGLMAALLGILVLLTPLWSAPISYTILGTSLVVVGAYLVVWSAHNHPAYGPHDTAKR